MRLHTFGGLWLALDDGAPATGFSQPRRLTLLAMVATGGSSGLSRDRIRATLWPESETERGRHALAQLVYSLRRSSGGQPLVLGDSQLRLDSISLSSDCGDLLAAASAGEHKRVATLYQGHFLDGFHVAESPDFEQWVDVERERFRRFASRSLEAMALDATEAGDAAAAAEAWRRSSELDPLDPKSAAGYLEALMSAGRRTVALQVAQKYEALLFRELDSRPDGKVREVIGRVRATGTSRPGTAVAPSPTHVPVSIATPVAAATPSPLPAPLTRRRWTVALGAVLALVLMLVLGQRWARPVVPVPSVQHISAVAVLPFTAMGSNAEDGYLSDGLTEDLTSRLASIPGLRVAARTSTYLMRDKAASLTDIGTALHVDAVVEGSVRRNGDSILVTTRLVGVRDGFELWTGTYARPAVGLMTLQKEVAEALVRALRRPGRVQPMRPAAAATSDLRAYNLYLRGRHAWNRRSEDGLLTALASFDSALALDSSYAVAAAGMASTWMLLPTYGRVQPSEAFAQARAAAARALALDSTLVEALTVSAYLRALYDRDVAAAESGFARAVASDPQYATAHHWRALNLVTLRRPQDARREIDAAMALDPLAPSVGAAAAAVSYYARDYAGAETAARGVLRLSPEFFPARTWLGLALLEQERAEEARDELERAVRESDGHWLPRTALAYTLARTGQPAAARALLAALEVQAAHTFVAPINLAFLYEALGDRSAAMRMVARGVEVRDPGALYLQVEPKLDALRDDPRFQAIIARAQLP